MGNAAINDQKRAEMKELMAKVFAIGNTTLTIAQALKVSRGTVSKWARGDSMGTNAQRDFLKSLLSGK